MKRSTKVSRRNLSRSDLTRTMSSQFLVLTEIADDFPLQKSPQDADESRSNQTPTSDDHDAEQSDEGDEIQNDDNSDGSGKNDDQNNGDMGNEENEEERRQKEADFNSKESLEETEDLRTIILRCAKKEDEKWWNNWWDLPAEVSQGSEFVSKALSVLVADPPQVRILIYKSALSRLTPLQRPDDYLRSEWNYNDGRAQELEQIAQDKEAYERDIAEILRRPRTEVKSLVKKKNKILIDDIKAKIIALDPN